jgi:hypothetical protein
LGSLLPEPVLGYFSPRVFGDLSGAGNRPQ